MGGVTQRLILSASLSLRPQAQFPRGRSLIVLTTRHRRAHFTGTMAIANMITFERHASSVVVSARRSLIVLTTRHRRAHFTGTMAIASMITFERHAREVVMLVVEAIRSSRSLGQLRGGCR